ncbi:MAG TPA: hypothetical protein VII38_04015 [Polyangia bacterium]
MTKDLTAILIPKGQLDEPQIRQILVERGLGDVFLRIAPLDAVGLLQIEVQEAHEGLPCEDPDLVGRFSKGGRAAFVHVNHTAKQAIVHAFEDGASQPGFIGAPGEELAAKLSAALGIEVALDAITSADDGSRVGIGLTSSRTVVLAGDSVLSVPPGMPTDLHSFAFHDRGAGVDEEEERLALFAFDPHALDTLWSLPGRALAEKITAAPPGRFGPLDRLRAEVAASLSALGEKSPMELRATELRALELCALEAGRVFAGGDNVSYWDERVLPMFALAAETPVFDPSELEDLDDSDSVLHAMVEVLPYAAPPGGEGAMLALLSDAELGPLAPWARPGQEYRGAIFTLRPERLLAQVRSLEGAKLKTRMETFERAWYRAARPGQPEGDPYDLWRRARAEEGQNDTDRFLRDWTELRIVLEVAAENRLQPALLFYEGV